MENKWTTIVYGGVYFAFVTYGKYIIPDSEQRILVGIGMVSLFLGEILSIISSNVLTIMRIAHARHEGRYQL